MIFSSGSEALLYLPDGLGTVTGPFEKQLLFPQVCKSFLVIREPLEWVLACYLQSCSVFEFKTWFRSTPPPIQSDICPNPDKVIRGEFFMQDIKEAIGVDASLKLALLAPTNPCPTTRANILRRYKRDYELGDYLAEF